jgi:hypothetical protein
MVGRAAILGVLGTALLAAPASAEGLVRSPDTRIGCGERIQSDVA